MQIVKRNGEVVGYCGDKIYNALKKCVDSIGVSFDTHYWSIYIAKKVSEEMVKDIYTVDEILDIIEQVLVEHNYYEIAKTFILYRENHKKLRESNKIFLDSASVMHGYLYKEDWRVNENSNMDYSVSGLVLHNNGAITAKYWLDNVYTKDISDAHSNGDIHIHDLGMFSGYCAGWSLRQLLTEGLNGVPNKVSSKPAKHLSTLVNQMVNFLGILQNEWAGAQAFSSFDTYLAPFVKVDKMSFREVKQCVQSFVYGINTPSRFGSQAPFVNVTFDWVVPEDLKNQPAIVGGELKEFTYSDCQSEMDMINRAFLEVIKEGDAAGRGFSFPIPTYNLTKNFNWDSENANLLFEITGKYGTPYFQNFINSDLNPGDVRSMCCRLRLDKRELRKRGGGLFGADEFTGSIGVVTINMARIGYVAASEKEFFDILSDKMEISKRSLQTKRKIINLFMKEGFFPYSKRYLRNLNNHFSTIGLIGMNESLMNMGLGPINDTKGKSFAVKVLNFMNEKLKEYQTETGNLFNLEATPGESTSYRLAKIDKEKYPDMFIMGDKNPYYTNSTQLPVNHGGNIFEALIDQEELQTLYTGGTVFHGFIGEEIPASVCKMLVKKIATSSEIPYFTISPTYSICQDHGYIIGDKKECPLCGNQTEVYSRIVGYYRPYKNWNLGKKEEYKERHYYDINI